MIHPQRRLNSTPRGFIAIVVLGSVAAGMLQAAAARWSGPDDKQRIVAKLVTWGFTVQGLPQAVDPDAIEQRLTQLRSSISEERVQAAEWLAARGVRQSGGNIVAAMRDPGTLRPCQLAKSLGSIGDRRWVPELAAATRQRRNTDLQVCATLALGELQAPEAVDALMQVYRDNTAPITALRSLGRIADPASLALLEQVVASPRTPSEQAAARTALQRTRVMLAPDPVEALLDRLRQGLGEQAVDTWAVRKLATLGDARAVPVLEEAMFTQVSRDDRIALAAALLAHAETGRAALHRIEAEASGGANAVARAALSLAAHSTAVALNRSPTSY